MADEETTVVESKATAEQQAEAEKLGWIPPSRFKGDAARFVDAEEYIERGKTVLPIVKEQNRRLHTELELLKASQAKSDAALEKANKLLEDIEERHSVETQKAVEAARKELKRSLVAASEADDHEAVAELTDQLTQLNKEAAPPAKKEEKVAEVSQLTAEQLAEVKAWWSENAPWYGVNRRKTSLALGISQELREAGETAQGPAFFKLVLAEVNKEYAAKETPHGNKVESARGGSESDRSNGKKGYAQLPADAKAACDADARKFVGEGKKYKDVATWRNRYAEIYFASEA